MAASATMQVIPMSLSTTRAIWKNRLLPAAVEPPCHRSKTSIRIRCTAEENSRDQPTPVSSPTPPSPVLESSPTASSPAPKVSTKFTDILAFGGPAPERINGRLAMIGFVAAMAVEVSKGQDVFEQISNGGIPWFVGTSIVLSLASLIPLAQGVTVESKSKGLMSSNAELWNGRFAMLGLVALAFTEYVKGGSLV